jgi:hypothetical protein
MNQRPALRQIAERIALSAFWEGPYDDSGKTTWLASIPVASGLQQIGTMTLTRNRLVVCEDRLFVLGSIASGVVGEFSLPASPLVPSASEFGSQPKSVVTIAVDGQITVSGPATHLMLLLLAHGLGE